MRSSSKLIWNLLKSSNKKETKLSKVKNILKRLLSTEKLCNIRLKNKPNLGLSCTPILVFVSQKNRHTKKQQDTVRKPSLAYIQINLGPIISQGPTKSGKLLRKSGQTRRGLNSEQEIT